MWFWLSWCSLQPSGDVRSPESLGGGMGWSRKSRDLLHEGPFIPLYRDEVVRPDGEPGVYDHVAVNDGVRVVALDGDGRIVLVEDDFYLKGTRVLHLPGGGCGGQSPMDAAARELEEETGWCRGDSGSWESSTRCPPPRVPVHPCSWRRS